MGRLHLFEIEDQSWCPKWIRDAITGFLNAVTKSTNLYAPVASRIERLMVASGTQSIVVLGAGSGGGILSVVPELRITPNVTLTDLYPPQNFGSNASNVRYYPESVNALEIPDHIKGIRVLFATFHHFRPNEAQAIISSAVRDRAPIFIVEGTERSPVGIFATVFIPILVLLFMPKVRPLRWTSFVFTYLIPILPIVIFWDGLVSAIRTYTVEELAAMTAQYQDYEWKIEILRGPRGEKLPTLSGHPKF